MTTPTQTPPIATMGEDEAASTIKQLAHQEAFLPPERGPILRTPADAGLDYENVWFLSQDGVPLEAWYIPRAGSDKLIIANHPRWHNRYGLASHLEPWKSIFAPLGNDIEVNFIPDYRILYDAGFNVLTYDERNCGHSGAANAGLNSGGRFEARDVVGSLTYARTRPDLEGMTIGLLSRCQGANASIFAMAQQPEQFAGVRCMVAAQPVSVGVILQQSLQRLGIPDRYDDLDREFHRLTSYTLADLSPVAPARAVTVPTFLYQVHDDIMVTPSDVQAVCDAIPNEKQLHWIHGTTRRWDGYLHFQREPQQALEWFATHMG
jgi:uncharacterized protein